MTGFSPAWLALREPYDRAARSRRVLAAVGQAFTAKPAVAVTDLGCGTGATLRALAPLLPVEQRWQLVDHDEAVLAAATAAAPPGTEIVKIDLARHLEAALDDPGDLITMSALLDLVSAAWLDRLIAATVRLARPLYAALSYDGRVTLTPATPDDSAVIGAVNRHQTTDKGFGAALSPAAAAAAVAGFRRAGFDVIEDRSDWHFAASDRDIQMEMIDGWADAAGEMGVSPSELAAWRVARRDAVAAGRSTMQIGHVDFFARPMSMLRR